MGITTVSSRDVARRFRFIDDFVDPTLNAGWDIVTNTVNGTAAILNADVADASEGVGNVELVSGATLNDIIDMQWDDGSGTGAYVPGGSGPRFRSRVNIVGPLAQIRYETGLTNLNISMIARVYTDSGGNWFLEAFSPIGTSNVDVDTGIASAPGRTDIVIDVVPAQSISVVINGERFNYTADPDAVGRTIERCRPFARVTATAAGGGSAVVDYIEVQGNRP